MTDSISQSEHIIDENVKTAVIYSVSDLGNYLVEIRHQQDKYFINKNGESEQFGNMSSAKKAAMAEGAEVGFQALSRTYQEVEATTAHLSASQDGERFDYIKINLEESL